MPHFLFIFEPAQAGCVERVSLSTPWHQPVQTRQGQIMDPGAQAWAYLMNFAQQKDQFGQPCLIFPNGLQPSGIKCICTNPTGHSQQPNVYCIQKTEPMIDRQQINAPYNMPVSSGGGLTLPPVMQAANAPRAAPQGMYEDLTDSALPSTADAVFGEMDGAGGTYTDLDSRGNEIKRGLTSPYPNKVGQ